MEASAPARSGSAARFRVLAPESAAGRRPAREGLPTAARHGASPRPDQAGSNGAAPKTTVTLTRQGRAALGTYTEALRDLLGGL
ncbi:MAG TPA: hypothetical protein VF204_01375 [Streptosporangiaceae bacterium]